MNKNTHCRLCDGALTPAFSLAVLSAHTVGYFECENCGSLQTEEPFWLNETYGDAPPGEDIGAVSRCVENRLHIFFLMRYFFSGQHPKVLDYGGGNGLLTRMLRDIGVDAHVYDKYCENKYAVGFERDGPEKFDAVVAFEVFEHLPVPKNDLRDLFEGGPKLVYCSTVLYRQQDSNWSYLCPKSGGHVFFYSPQAIEYIADQFGYEALTVGSHILFKKDGFTATQRLFVNKILFSRANKLLQIAFHFIPKPSFRNHDQKLMVRMGLDRNI